MPEDASPRSNAHASASTWQESSKEPLVQGNRETSLWANPVFQLAGIQVVVPRKEVKDLPEGAYDEPARSMKCLIKELQDKDSFVQQLKSNDVEHAGSRRRRADGWAIDPEGLVRHEDKLFVPGDPATREELICRNHDDPLAGHFGAEKTLELLQRKYYWPACGEQVKEYVRSCNICQRTKVPRHKPYGELSSLPAPKKPWKEITMDFVTGLPPSKRRGVVYDSILVVVDRYTKMVRYVPVTKKTDAAELAEVFFDEVVLRFGMPDGIVSDRGSVFTSAFWSAVCYHARIRRRLSTAFHPQTDGQTERQNQVLEHYLRCFANEKQINWANLLPLAEFASNNSLHSSAGATPFYLMYGYYPEIRYEVEDNFPEGEVPSAKDRVEQLQSLREGLEERLKKAAEYQAKYYNKNHKPREFAVGELVLLSTRNLNQKRPSKKMSPKFAGPFRIEDKIGKQAYRLTLPSTYRIHNVFHVSLLEPYHHRAGGKDAHEFMQAPDLIDDDEQWEVEEIVDRTKVRGDGIWYQVKWAGWGEEYNQWLPEGELDNAADLRDEFDEKVKAPKRRRRK